MIKSTDAGYRYKLKTVRGARMILKGHKKRLVTEVVRYYVETTGSTYDDFILTLTQTKNKSEENYTYPEWLAVRSYGMLKAQGIDAHVLVSNKDIVNASVNADSSRKEGEFYTPEVWCVEGRSYLKDLLGDLWGQAYVWDASCGSGNLMRSENYPADKLFMSSLLPEDIDIVKADNPDATVFQLDFLNGIDLDDNNKLFSQNLPPNLLKVLENDEPLVFYMNPPYKVMEASSSDVGLYMSSQGMSKSALDIFHQFMYRIVMLKRFYGLTNVYLGIFGPITMFHSDMIKPLYDEFKSEFKFQGGMCFDAGDFANTSESVGWVVGYTTWACKKEGEEDKSIVLTAKALDENDTIKEFGSKLITAVEENIHEWVKAQDIVRYDEYLPIVTNYNRFSDRFAKTPSNYLGGIMSSNYVIRATRRCSITTLPNPDLVPITQENFWRAVASFTARRCYMLKVNSFNNSQYMSKPDMSVEGYDQWLLDSLVVFLFDNASHQSAYRGIDLGHEVRDFANRLFPIPKDIVKSVVTDENILKDMEENDSENEFLLSILNEAYGKFSPEAKELYEHCLSLILETLTATNRRDFDYANWSVAWDAGFLQLRDIKGLISDEKQEKYRYLLSRLKHKLSDGVYKYGFIMDAAFVVEDTEDYIEEEDGYEFEEVL